MQVELLDPPLRWHVTSEHGHAPYLVDLGEFDGNGMCDCKHFCCVLAPKLELGYRGEGYMCKHIKRARRHLADLVVQKFLEDEKVRSKIKIKFPEAEETDQPDF